MDKIPLSTKTATLSRQVIVDSLKVSFVVGTILAIINHGPEIFTLTLSEQAAYQIALTYLVPYCVSTYSAVKAIQKTTSQENLPGSG